MTLICWDGHDLIVDTSVSSRSYRLYSMSKILQLSTRHFDLTLALAGTTAAWYAAERWATGFTQTMISPPTPGGMVDYLQEADPLKTCEYGALLLILQVPETLADPSWRKAKTGQLKETFDDGRTDRVLVFDGIRSDNESFYAPYPVEFPWSNQTLGRELMLFGLGARAAFGRVQSIDPSIQGLEEVRLFRSHPDREIAQAQADAALREARSWVPTEFSGKPA